MKTKELVATLPTCSTVELLEELQSRGGHPGALATAMLLCAAKSADYNGAGAEDMHTVDRTVYFPFGTVSYAQMIHTKAQRFVALTEHELCGNLVNFEGLRDTALDLINYAGFYLASLESE